MDNDTYTMYIVININSTIYFAKTVSFVFVHLSASKYPVIFSYHSNSYIFSFSQDYPSLSQIREKLKANKIIPIFAVTKGVFEVYEVCSQSLMLNILIINMDKHDIYV